MAKSRRVLRLGRRSWQAVAAAGVTAALVAGGGAVALADTLPSGPATTGQTGLRPSATRVSFRLSDRINASVDVATGNLNISGTLLSLPGVKEAAPITLAYNSLASVSGDNFFGGADAPGWTYGLAGAGSLSLQSNNSTVDFTSTDGAVWPFTPVSGSSSAYTAPPGLKAVLMKTSSGWTLYYLQSSETVTFDGTGRPLAVTDRNGNATSVNWSAGTISSSAGSTDARTAYGYYDSTYKTDHIYQDQNGSQARQWLVSQNAAGQIQSWQTPDGNSTFATYNSAGQMVKFWNEGDYELDFTYDSAGRITEVDQVDHSQRTTKAPTASTRFSYVSSMQTQVAGPNTSLSQSVSAAPHVTYTVDPSDELVTQAVDQMGRVQSATYTGNLDVHTSTAGGSTTTNTYGANNSMSLTSSATQGGATTHAAYGNTTQSQQYQPSTTTDAAGNQTNYSYNTAGNVTGTTNGSGSQPAAQPVVTYNSDGTVATATLPGNGSNDTVYGYNSLHELTSVTPPTGTSLGVKRYTYDSYGRLATATDGAGHTTTYTYDNEDRVLTTSFSDSTPTVTNTYDITGNLTQQSSSGGTITNTYDVFNHLVATSNTAGGGTISYGYDRAGDQTSVSDSRGTTTESYDASGVLTATTYPKGTGTSTTNFVTNSNGQRTDTYLAANSTNSTWAAHVHDSFDSSGRTSRVQAWTGGSSSPSEVMDVTYCYNTGGSGTNCATTTTSDRSKLQWTYNNLTGKTTTFTYDSFGRLTGVAESGSSAGNNTYAYTYSANGDRISAVVTGSNPSSQSLTYNAADQITSSGYSYDAAGNMTASPGATYSYNGAEQMTSATESGTTYNYTYAGASQNEVLSQNAFNTTYEPVYGAGGTIAQFIVAGYKAYVEQDPTTGQPTMLHSSTDAAMLYVYDGFGNPVALLADGGTSTAQFKYDPYGLGTVTQTDSGNGIGQDPYGFKGGIYDRATGFVKFGQRWYDPTIGSWTQQDTLDSPLDPANANRYAFGSDDPLNNSDASGQEACSSAVEAAYGTGLVTSLSAAVAILGAAGELPSGGADTVATVVATGTFAGTAATLPAAEDAVRDDCPTIVADLILD